MGIEVRGVDHQPVRLGPFACQFGKDPVEHAQTAPADEAVLDRLVWAIVLRRVTPAQSVADHEDDPRDHTPVVNPRNAMG